LLRGRQLEHKGTQVECLPLFLSMRIVSQSNFNSKAIQTCSAGCHLKGNRNNRSNCRTETNCNYPEFTRLAFSRECQTRAFASDARPLVTGYYGTRYYHIPYTMLDPYVSHNSLTVPNELGLGTGICAGAQLDFLQLNARHTDVVVYATC